MENKLRNKSRKKVSVLIKIVVFISISLVCIKLGSVAGDIISHSDIKVINSIDVEYFKQTLNDSFPIIDTIYNSGNISVSFSGEMKSLIYRVFNFDLNNPITILNSQSPLFYRYYTKDYPKLLAKEEKKEDTPIVIEDTSPKKDTLPKENTQEFKQDESSIYFEETEEKKAPDSKVVTSGKISVLNETKFKIDINGLMKESINVKKDKKGPKVLIYHTHTNESFVPSVKDLNKKGIPSRTSDERYSVVRVGEELARNLRKTYDVEVIHNGTFHNYPSDVGAYGRSLNTASKILKSYPSIKMMFDVHRDGKRENEKLRVVTKVKNKNVAKVMFVVGTNGTGLAHPNWKENLKLAIKLQENLNKQCPGLAKPIYISNNRYNQHLINTGLIIEIGGDGNVLDECLESTKYLAKAIYEVMYKNNEE